jgi:hypothetical protein
VPMPTRKPDPPAKDAPLPRWDIYIIRKKGEFLGVVEASAIAEGAEYCSRCREVN